VSITSLDSVRSFRVTLPAFGTMLATHKQRATEFAPNSHLYREIIHTLFLQTEILHFQEQQAAKRWPASPEGFFFLFQQNTGEIAQMLWLVIDLLGGT
jgi:hypothetical protein